MERRQRDKDCCGGRRGLTPDGKAQAIVLSIVVTLVAIFCVHMLLVIGDQDHVETIINVERFDLTLVSDADNARIVSGNFLFLIDKRVTVTVGGDILNETMSKRDFYSWAGNATIVRGTDLFVLNEPAAPGDEVEIMIWHGTDKTAVTVTLEAAT